MTGSDLKELDGGHCTSVSAGSLDGCGLSLSLCVSRNKSSQSSFLEKQQQKEKKNTHLWHGNIQSNTSDLRVGCCQHARASPPSCERKDKAGEVGLAIASLQERNGLSRQ